MYVDMYICIDICITHEVTTEIRADTVGCLEPRIYWGQLGDTANETTNGPTRDSLLHQDQCRQARRLHEALLPRDKKIMDFPSPTPTLPPSVLERYLLGLVALVPNLAFTASPIVGAQLVHRISPSSLRFSAKDWIRCIDQYHGHAILRTNLISRTYEKARIKALYLVKNEHPKEVDDLVGHGEVREDPFAPPPVVLRAGGSSALTDSVAADLIEEFTSSRQRRDTDPEHTDTLRIGASGQIRH